MKRVLSFRPSPALVIACVALFISLGGVSYGLATGLVDTRAIRDNTIRTEDLRNNDIRAIDIRNSTIRSRDVALNTLTGSDIAESKLGQVPSAAKADDAASLGGAGASSYLRRDTSSFLPLPPAPAWDSIAGETAPGYFVDPIGFVHLQGALRRAAGTSELALSLPSAARPATTKRLPVYAETPAGDVNAAGVRIDPGGDVRVRGSSSALDNLVSLDGVTFRAGG